MARLIEQGTFLREAGVAYEDIQRRSELDAIPFNTAIEVMYRERSSSRLGSERAAAAVEFAIVAPLLFMLIFGVIQFGIAFLEVQSIRGAVREGGRAAAVGGDVDAARDAVISAAAGAIPASLEGSISVSSTCVKGADQEGTDVAVSFPVGALNGGTGIPIQIPFIPPMTLTPTVTAHFRCEVS
jgi:Flp pilus assembly protein TadG